MTVPSAIFNEIEPYAVEWLKNLVAAGLIAPGAVDGRSISDLTPEDVRGPGQRHFFAGIAVWSRALRIAGWPDDLLDVWTGSCPCQPLSQAGRQKGFEDERHLWPVWFQLIAECKPPVVFGEQVASPLGLAWLDLVFADLEGAGYTCAAADLCAAGIGAPHIRQRLFFVAIRKDVLGNACLPRSWRYTGAVPCAQGEGEGERVGAGSVADLPLVASPARVLGDTTGARQAGSEDAGADRGSACEGGRSLESERAGATRLVADDTIGGCGEGRVAGGRASGEDGTRPPDGVGARVLADATGDAATRIGGAGATLQPHPHGPARALADHHDDGSQGVGAVRLRGDGDAQHWLDPNGRGPTGGFWADAQWIPCRDGKARPVEPGTFPLADGAPTRVAADGSMETQPRGGALKAYGNAIVVWVAVEFIRAVIDILVAANAANAPQNDGSETVAT